MKICKKKSFFKPFSLAAAWEIPQDAAQEAPMINTAPGAEYQDNFRLWQGIPGIERMENGRLWACFYSGGTREGNDNYVIITISEDDGVTWSPPKS